MPHDLSVFACARLTLIGIHDQVGGTSIWNLTCQLNLDLKEPAQSSHSWGLADFTTKHRSEVDPCAANMLPDSQRSHNVENIIWNNTLFPGDGFAEILSQAASYCIVITRVQAVLTALC